MEAQGILWGFQGCPGVPGMLWNVPGVAGGYIWGSRGVSGGPGDAEDESEGPRGIPGMHLGIPGVPGCPRKGEGCPWRSREIWGVSQRC